MGRVSILHQSVSEINEILKVLRVEGARVGLKTNVMRSKSLKLRLSKDEKVTLGNEMTDQLGSFTCLGKYY